MNIDIDIDSSRKQDIGFGRQLGVLPGGERYNIAFEKDFLKVVGIKLAGVTYGDVILDLEHGQASVYRFRNNGHNRKAGWTIGVNARVYEPPVDVEFNVTMDPDDHTFTPNKGRTVIPRNSL